MPASMPAAAVTDERWKTLLWRQEELERAGYPLHLAMTIAERFDIDLHDACDLIQNGCTPAQAADILL